MPSNFLSQVHPLKIFFSFKTLQIKAGTSFFADICKSLLRLSLLDCGTFCVFSTARDTYLSRPFLWAGQLHKPHNIFLLSININFVLPLITQFITQVHKSAFFADKLWQFPVLGHYQGRKRRTINLKIMEA